MSSIINFIMYLAVPFLFLLAFCITIHELGHFLAAKLFGIPVEKFSIGYGPPLIRKQIGETDFRIAYFPLGGYVKMAGDDEGNISGAATAEPDTGQPGFYDKPAYKRILVIFAGPLFNIASALLVLIITFAFFGLSVDPYTRIEVEVGSFADRAGLMTGDSLVTADQKPVHYWDDFLEIVADNMDNDIEVGVMRAGTVITVDITIDPDSFGITNLVPPVLANIKHDGPADHAGMEKGDTVLSINDTGIETWAQMYGIVSNNPGTPLVFRWRHNGNIQAAEITPRAQPDPISGDTLGKIDVMKPHTRVFLPPIETVVLAVQRTGEGIYGTLSIFWQLTIGRISRRALGGPIAIAQLTAESVAWGPEFLFGLLVAISVNLGLINLFPIPALDGGHILIASVEGIRRKQFSRRTRLIIQQVGYALILFLIIFVTFNDLTR
jgi:regulator of sigma E protease